MLVLTRKMQEKIRIGDEITITVIKTKGKSVRLGIEAPAHVPVLRGELQPEPPIPPGAPRLTGETPGGGVHFARVPKNSLREPRVRSTLGEGLTERGPLSEMVTARC